MQHRKWWFDGHHKKLLNKGHRSWDPEVIGLLNYRLDINITSFCVEQSISLKRKDRKEGRREREVVPFLMDNGAKG
ncbi:hypothetical protein XENTR_v10008508 [Xenopus tropicalis]|nr:hypothetical protein XENTR_v10008508 [Xenopus tropicalis]